MQLWTYWSPISLLALGVPTCRPGAIAECTDSGRKQHPDYAYQGADVS